MANTDDYRRGYGRGYVGGARWPEHKPPSPPEEITGELVAALRNLRDIVDGELAMFSAEDDINIVIGPAIDRADKALEKLGAWIKAPQPTATGR